MDNRLNNVVKMVLQKRYCRCKECGSILELQKSFDENADINICETCGTRLLNPFTTYNGELYPGVIWHCDECDAVLNIQEDFVDWKLYHKCTECGFTNRISKQDIYESKQDYLNHCREVSA